MAFTRNDYTIGWIATLDIELAAAKAMLDRPYHPKLPKAVKDTNTYTLGRIGDHNVVIAGLPSGAIGTNSAAIAASNLTRSFPKVRFILMVGIGEGVSIASLPPMKDVRLGDIVVSSPNGFHGGVVQFDYGTATSGGFMRKGTLNKPPVAVRTALQDLRSDALMEGYKFQSYYDEMLHNFPSMAEKYERPRLDRLYKTQCVHAGADCSQCPEDMLEARSARKSSDPVVHYGTIGSANKVVRDHVLRDKLYNEEGVICLDLAAAGLMDGFECLVIRGIADYCDTHKNEDWQPYASAMAASFAKEFLLAIQPDEVEGMPHIRILGSIHDSMRQIHKQTELLCSLQEVELYRSAIQWLAAPDPELDFRAARNLRHPETGAWLLNSESYLEWKRGSVKHFWLFGKIGSGKSVMSAAIIDDVRRYCENCPDSACGIFYFNFSDKQKQTYENCLYSLVSQLTSKEPALSMLVKLYRSSYGSPEVSHLEQILLSAIDSCARTFIIIDALDESTEEADGNQTARQRLMNKLIWLTEMAPNLSFLITSRDLVDMWWIKSQIGASSVSMRTECVDRDIIKYVRSQFINDVDIAKFDAATKTEIEATVLWKSDGMFHWAYCLVQELKRLILKRRKYITEILDSSLGSLDCIYDRMLSRIPERFQGEAFSLIYRLAYSMRPLSLKELVDSLQFDPEEIQVKRGGSWPAAEEILDLLGGLVEPLRGLKEGTITSTAEDFSTKGFSISSADSEDKIANGTSKDLDDCSDNNAKNNCVALANLNTSSVQAKKGYSVIDLAELGENTMVKLAHSSIKEYLESKRILKSSLRFAGYRSSRIKYL